MLDVDEVFTREDEELNEILADVPEAEEGYFPPGTFDQIDELKSSSQSNVRAEQIEDDFMLEAQKLLDVGEVKTMTEAMRKVRHQHPELHEAFKAESRSPQQSVDARQFKSNKKFVELSERCRLTLDQAAQARKAGHPEIAAGTLVTAKDICREIGVLLRQDKYAALLARREELTKKLHTVILGGKGAEQLTGKLAAVDRQIEVL